MRSPVPHGTNAPGSGDILDDMDDIQLLWQEFNAADSSFLLQLRVDLHWDRHAFSRLEQAMRRVCTKQETQAQLDRWLVEGYWYLAEFVPGHTSHPAFPRPRHPGSLHQGPRPRQPRLRQTRPHQPRPRRPASLINPAGLSCRTSRKPSGPGRAAQGTQRPGRRLEPPHRPAARRHPQ